MELIYLLESLFGKISFEIGEYEFVGCRPIPFMGLPWRNKKERVKFYQSLSKENTPASYAKYTYFEEQNYFQMIHMTFSRSFLCAIAGVILLILTAFFFVANKGTVSLIFLSASVFMMVLSFYLRYRANRHYRDFCMGQVLSDYFETWPSEDKEESK
jgi:uncharacterized integral membrane protein